MKLIRWFFSNIILIVIVLSASYAYVYWDNLDGEDTPLGQTLAWLSGFEGYDQVAGFVDDVSDTITEVTTDVPEETVSSTDEKVAQPKTVDTADASPEPSPQVVASNPNQLAMQAMPEQAPMAPSETSAEMPQPERYVTPEIEEALNEAAKSAEGDVTNRSRWIDARKAFYRRDFDAAVSGYEELIADDPDNFDAYGELGNVYFNRGEMEAAVDNYYFAAEAMVRKGQRERAASLINLLQRFDGSRADQLRALLAEQAS